MNRAEPVSTCVALHLLVDRCELVDVNVKSTPRRPCDVIIGRIGRRSRPVVVCS